MSNFLLRAKKNDDWLYLSALAEKNCQEFFRNIQGVKDSLNSSVNPPIRYRGKEVKKQQVIFTQF